MTNESPRILLLGNTQTAEMRAVAAVVQRVVDHGDVRPAQTTAAVARLVTAENWHPDLVVVCQSWPDEFPPEDARRLFALVPLARCVCCFGLWCESDGRTRNIWPPAARVPARAAEPRILQELAVLRGESPPLPPTAGRDEAFEFACRDVVPGQSFRGPAIVVSPDRELQRWIEDLAAESGCTRADDPSSASVVLWDVDPWRPEAAEALRDFRTRHRHVLLIGLAGFASPQDAATMSECGLDALVTKLQAQAELSMLLAARTSADRWSNANASSDGRRGVGE